MGGPFSAQKSIVDLSEDEDLRADQLLLGHTKLYASSFNVITSAFKAKQMNFVQSKAAISMRFC